LFGKKTLLRRPGIGFAFTNNSFVYINFCGGRETRVLKYSYLPVTHETRLKRRKRKIFKVKALQYRSSWEQFLILSKLERLSPFNNFLD